MRPVKSMCVAGLGVAALLACLMAGAQQDEVQAAIEAQRTQIAMLRGQFGDASLDDEARLAALRQAQRRLADLIAAHPEHWQRPMWQCDLAEMRLFDELEAVQHHAVLTLDFGIATAAQTAAVAELAPATHKMLEEARGSFTHLERTLPRRDDHAARVDSGLWAQWLRYREMNLPLLLARAACATALLPRSQDAPRLFEQAYGQARILAEDDTLPPALQTDAALLAARAAMRLGRRDAAAAMLAVVEKGDVQGITAFAAALTRAAMAAAGGDAPRAEALLTTVLTSPAASGDPMLALLARDARYRLALGQQGDAVAALAVYRPLFETRAGRDDHETLQRQVLALRWLQQWPDAEAVSAAKLPHFVMLAMADAALQSGRAAMAQNRAVAFARARALTEAMLHRGDALDAATAATAMYLHGWAIYEAAPLAPLAQFDAARVWTDLARRHPRSEPALAALADAVLLLRELHRAPAGVDGDAARQAYADAAALLLTSFPTSAAADDERLYYAHAVLMPAGRFDEATVVLGDVPATHRDYLAAQRERLYARLGAYRASPWYQRPQLAEPVERSAEHLEKAATLHAAANDGPVVDARVHVRLVRAELAIDRQDFDGALVLLDEAESLAGRHAGLRQSVWERRIYALMEADRLTEAAGAARRLLDDYPGEAVEVIYRLVDRVGAAVDVPVEQQQSGTAAQREAAAQRRRNLLRMAGEMAQVVLEREEGLSAAQRRQFELMAARTAAMAGDLADAETRLRHLARQQPKDAVVTHHLAEVLRQRAGESGGDAAGLAEAADLYRRLIDGLDARSPLWWNAWLRTLEIQALRHDGPDVEIYLAVRRLEALDANLGGEPYRAAFRRLARDHEPRDTAP